MKHHRRAFASSIAANFGINERTLWRWKNALETDDELSALYEKRLNEIYTRDWVEVLDTNLSAFLNRMLELALIARLCIYVYICAMYINMLQYA